MGIEIERKFLLKNDNWKSLVTETHMMKQSYLQSGLETSQQSSVRIRISNKLASINIKSADLRMVRQECMATVGAVSNPDNSNQNFGKAGRNRHKGIRPSVRGVVMNPVDHPHGGGEGRTSGGRHPVTPWGKPTKGAKTRNKKKASSKLIIRSRHAKRKGR